MCSGFLNRRMALTPGAYSQFGQDTDNTMEFCLHEVGHSGNDEKIGAPPVRLDRDNGNVVGLAIAYTIANADRELPGTVTKFL